MSIRFDDRVAIVTGAGNGLGKAYALLLASRGCAVVVNDLGGGTQGTGASTSAADAVVAEIQAAGGKAAANYDSVADEAGAKNMVQTALDNFGGVDIVINNAGILRDKSFHNATLDDFRLVANVHYLGSAYVTHAAWPHLRAKGYGRVIMTTSSAGLFGNFGQANYGSAKLAVVGLANTLAVEGAKAGIRVNAISPIAVTRLSGSVFPPGLEEKIKPELVAPAVAWLASEACNVTGEVIVAGGGYFARARMVESAGKMFGPDAPISPETFGEHYGEIADLSSAQPYGSAMEAVGKLLGMVM